MIYLIEGVLPESYFANNLRGLSVDMAVFRELMRVHLPELSRHLETLQHEAADQATGKCSFASCICFLVIIIVVAFRNLEIDIEGNFMHNLSMGTQDKERLCLEILFRSNSGC